MLYRILIRSRHFTMNAYIGSVRFSGPGPSQIWTFTLKHIPCYFRQQVKSVVYVGSDMFLEFHPIESQGQPFDGLPKGKESKTDQKPPCEEHSRKRLRQWVSHAGRRNSRMDRIGWRQRMDASCSARSQEQEEEEKDVSREHWFLKAYFRTPIFKKTQ